MVIAKKFLGYVLIHRGELAWVTEFGPRPELYTTAGEANADACPMCEIAEVWM